MTLENRSEIDWDEVWERDPTITTWEKYAGGENYLSGGGDIDWSPYALPEKTNQ